jgi:SAM-dependent methyltransferase
MPAWVSLAISRAERRYDEIVNGTAERMMTLSVRSKLAPIIDAANGHALSETDRYWRRHTVRGKTFLSRQTSLDYIKELTDGRPLKRKLLGLHGPHTGKVILDYGCGPGNDLVGFAEFSNAAKIIGVDISPKALELARSRVSWHVRDPGQLAFIRIADENIKLPLSDASVDYIQSLGVIHHASNPNAIFREFHRLLKPGAEARIMLYNADSLHIQLEIGYIWRLVNGLRAHQTAEELFTSTADLGAPIAHCVRPPDVVRWMEGVPLDIEFAGGYFVPGELTGWQEKREQALTDDRLSEPQRRFLTAIERREGLAYFEGKPAGLGAVYRLTKPSNA